MKYEAIGYCWNDAVEKFTRQDADRLTCVNLAFGLIRDGLLDLSLLKYLHLLPKLREWNPELKIVLSVGGWAADGFSPMAMTEQGRRAFAASCLETVETYGLDGIDIDWEYPCSDAAGIAADPRDKENFTALLRVLREKLGDDRILSVAVGASRRCVQDTQMDQVAQIVDYVQLMTYDMVDGTRAGHHAALGASKGDTSGLNTREVVEDYHAAGVPYEKLIVGAAFYGRHFEVENRENNGLLQPSGGGLPGPTYGEITESYLRENGFQVLWDEDAEANYLWNGKTLVSYESPEAIRRKCEFVREKKLRGIMYWEHGNDPTRELLGVIADTLGK